MVKIIDVASLDLDDLDVNLLRRSLRSITTVLVRPNDPAFAVARELDRRPGALAVVLDKTDEPVAILVPEHVKLALKEHKGINAETLETALRYFAQDPDEVARQFRHEWLIGRTNVGWCDVHEHYTSLPCSHL